MPMNCVTAPPDYEKILLFLAQNPPELETERQMHASLLELLAQCLRVSDDNATLLPAPASAQQNQGQDHAILPDLNEIIKSVNFN